MKEKNLFILVSFTCCLLVALTALWLYKDDLRLTATHTVWHERLLFDYARGVCDTNLSLCETARGLMQGFILRDETLKASLTHFSLAHLVYLMVFLLPVTGLTKYVLVVAMTLMQAGLVIFLTFSLAKKMLSRQCALWAVLMLFFFPGFIGVLRHINTELLIGAVVLTQLFWMLSLHTKTVAATWAGFTFFLVIGHVSGPLYWAFGLPLMVFACCDFFMRKKPSGLISIGGAILVLISVVYIQTGSSFFEYINNIIEALGNACNALFFQTNNFIGSAKEGLVSSFLFASQDAQCPCTQTTNVGFNMKTFLFYLVQLARYISIPFLVLGTYGFFMFFRSKDIERRTKGLLLFYAVGSYFLLSIYDIKWGKFLIPLLPILAFFCGYALTHVKHFRKTIQVVAICLGMGIIIHSSFFADVSLWPLEKLYEGIVARRSFSSSFEKNAQEVAEAIKTDYSTGKPFNVGVADAGSLRFIGEEWITDKTVRFANLVRYHLPLKTKMTFFWNEKELIEKAPHEFTHILYIHAIDDKPQEKGYSTILEKRVADNVIVTLQKYEH